MSRQLILELGHRAAHAREDFLVAPSNEAAVAVIDSWPDWPAPALALSGPPGSGKTHLAEVWHAMSGARKITSGELAKSDLPSLVAAGAVILEDAGDLGPTGGLESEGQKALFHLINLVKEEGAFLLIAARQPPSQWQVALPDLVSRLRAMPHVALGLPDDRLLAGILVKLFDDRQLRVGEPLIAYLLPRIERSVDAARRAVEALDRASLSGKRAITVPLAGEILGF